jgi:hypothetical protein
VGINKVVPLKKLETVSKDELDRQKVCQAIVLIHAERRYYDGMDKLCKVVGWPPIIREIDSSEEMNSWLCSVNPKKEKFVTKKYKSTVCKKCHRRYDPDKIYERKSNHKCAGCGRRINNKGGLK